MKVFPSFDFLNGKWVRLKKGDPKEITEYPINEMQNTLRLWEECGVKEIHVVDLDGAFSGSVENRNRIEEVRSSFAGKIQLGGGLRTEETVRKAIEKGYRPVIGSALLKNSEIPSWVSGVREHITAAVDCFNGEIVIKGWKESTGKKPEAFMKELVKMGVKRVLYTDVQRDGMLMGPNLVEIEKLMSIEGIQLIASGGVRDMRDIYCLSELGVYGVILGKAIHDGQLSIKEIMEVWKC